MSKRTSQPYQEYFLVASGNQTMPTSGNIKGTGATLNISDGMLGAYSAVAGSAVLEFGNFLTGAETAANLPEIILCQGTPASADNSDASGWASQDNGLVRSCKLKADEIISVTARHYQIPTYSAVALKTLADPLDDRTYSIFVNMNSRKLGRNNRGQKVASTSFDTNTIPSTVSADKDWLIQNLLYKLNLNSRKVRGNDSFVAFAINTGGSANGTPIGTIALGDSIPFMVYGGVTYSFVADKALMESIFHWIDDGHFTADACIVPINLATAGNKVAAVGTYTITNFANLAGDTVTVDGNALVEGVDWAAGGSNDAAATALAAAIDALASVTASADGAIVTVTAATAGAAGNAITTTYTAGAGVGATVSGATLAGGDDTNADALVILGLSHIAPAVYNGLAAEMVDVSGTEFGGQFFYDNTRVYEKICGAREPLGSGRYLLMAYDERGFAQKGLTSLNAVSDRKLQAPKYIDPDVNYTTIIIDGKAIDEKGGTQQYRVYILVPGTDDSAGTDAQTGITVTTNAGNTETSLNGELSDWLDEVVGITYHGDAVSGAICPA